MAIPLDIERLTSKDGISKDMLEDLMLLLGFGNLPELLGQEDLFLLQSTTLPVYLG